MPSSKAKGFTLIEVLIAAVILFLFLAMASQAFNQSAMSSVKAERAAKVAAVVPLLLQNIKQQISLSRNTSATGKGQFADVGYSWRANLLSRKPPARRLDPDTMEMRDYDERFNLWQVELEVSLDSYSHRWQYEEVSWYE